MLSYRKIREISGVVVKDAWRYALALYGPKCGQVGPPWLWLRNRHEQLTPNPSGPGVHCEWKWGSSLHACGVVPSLGRQLMLAALRQWPIRFASTPVSESGPRVSFLFAHRGRERLPQLRQVIQSVFAQRDVRVECIVVDLSSEPLAGELPSNVVYRHVDTSHLPPGWFKAWAFNLAARLANGDVVVFQDGDICVPERYGSEVAGVILDRGYEVASIQRFLFYLDGLSTEAVYQRECISPSVPVRVSQNWKGGTIALSRPSFFDLGGFDEGFVDWGGEDDEFYDRCAAKRHWQYGYVPFVHLYHRPQSDRHGGDNLNVNQVLPARLAIPCSQRIAELQSRGYGNEDGPSPRESYKVQLV